MSLPDLDSLVKLFEWVENVESHPLESILPSLKLLDQMQQKYIFKAAQIYKLSNKSKALLALNMLDVPLRDSVLEHIAEIELIEPHTSVNTAFIRVFILDPTEQNLKDWADWLVKPAPLFMWQAAMATIKRLSEHSKGELIKPPWGISSETELSLLKIVPRSTSSNLYYWRTIDIMEFWKLNGGTDDHYKAFSHIIGGNKISKVEEIMSYMIGTNTVVYGWYLPHYIPHYKYFKACVDLWSSNKNTDDLNLQSMPTKAVIAKIYPEYVEEYNSIISIITTLRA